MLDTWTVLQVLRDTYKYFAINLSFLFLSSSFLLLSSTCCASISKLIDFLDRYPIPSEYPVILPKSNQIIFDAPLGYVGLYTHSFSLANLRLPLTKFFYEVLEHFQVHISRLNHFGCAKLNTFVVMCKAYGCEPSLDLFRGFFNLCRAGKWLTFAKRNDFRNVHLILEDDDELAFFRRSHPNDWYGFPSASRIRSLLRMLREPKCNRRGYSQTQGGEGLNAGVIIVHPGSVAAHIKERKCKTRRGSLRPPVKRKLASGSSSSHVVRAKTSASKDDAPFLSISNDDEGLPDCFELKDVNACHLTISAITPPSWKGHLDNQMDLELLDLHEHCYARQTMVDNVVNRRACEFLQVIKKMSHETDVIKARERSREEECEGLRVKREAVMAEFD
ncbi:hypothetical protein Tco_0247746 [Tanacetum coccineum]